MEHAVLEFLSAPFEVFHFIPPFAGSRGGREKCRTVIWAKITSFFTSESVGEGHPGMLCGTFACTRGNILSSVQ